MSVSFFLSTFDPLVNILTARHIAQECGILTEGGIAIEGSKFRKMSDSEIDEILPKLQVIARAQPADKYTLVHRLRELGEVVAVTGIFYIYVFLIISILFLTLYKAMESTTHHS